jgi:hypothetical protein
VNGGLGAFLLARILDVLGVESGISLCLAHVACHSGHLCQPCHRLGSTVAVSCRSLEKCVLASVREFSVLARDGCHCGVNPGPWESSKPNVAGEWIENGLFVASLLVGGFGIYRMKGLRWFATAIFVLQAWVLAGAGLIAGMALSGQWL